MSSQKGALREQSEVQTLPKGKEIHALCKRLGKSPLEERAKIAIAGKYFSQGLEDEYEEICKEIAPTTQEEINLRNNQEIMVNLVRYSRGFLETHLKRAKELARITDMVPSVKTLYLLMQEQDEQEILKEGYKLDRACEHSALVKVISYVELKKYEDAKSILERLRETPQTVFLSFVCGFFTDGKETDAKYAKLCRIAERDANEECSSGEERPDTTYKKYADRLLGRGEGVHHDKIAEEIEISARKKAGSVLSTTESFVKDNTDRPEYVLHLISSSKKLKLEIELLRLELFCKKQRYVEAQALAETLKKNFRKTGEKTDEKIAVFLILTHIYTSSLPALDLAWVINALSQREQRHAGKAERERMHLADFVELTKRRHDMFSSFSAEDSHWIQKALELQDSRVLWKINIERARYLNRLGNIHFAHREIEDAEKKYVEALAIATEKDRKVIEENLEELNTWKKKEEPPIQAYPECRVLLENALPGAGNKSISHLDYVKISLGAEISAGVADALQRISQVLQKMPQKEEQSGCERTIGVLSLCALVKYQKAILSSGEVARSSISVVHNHVQNTIRNSEAVEESVVRRAQFYLRSNYSMAAQKYLAQRTLLDVLGHVSRTESPYKTEKLAGEIEKHYENEKEAEEIAQIKKAAQKELHALEEAAKKEAGAVYGAADAEKSAAERQDTQESAELTQIRDELVKALMELTEPKEKKTRRKQQEEQPKAPRKPRKRKEDKREGVQKSAAKKSDLENSGEAQKRQKKKEAGDIGGETEPVGQLKKKAQLVLSSDEESDA